MPRERKSGGVSNDERKFILDNMNKMSVQEIADKIKKSPTTVSRVIETHVSLPQAESETARWHLKRSPYWKHLKEEFNTDELNYIEDQYIKYVQQFKEDIIATEEIQILDLIKIDVLQQKNLKGKVKITENAHRYKEMVNAIIDRAGDFHNLDQADKEMVMDLENKIAACMQAESSRTTEYLDLQKQKNVLFDKIMGSRDQRVTQAINTKTSFSEYIKQLMDRDKQEKDSRFLGLMNKATDKEFERLSSIHMYADNVEDNPILCAEVVEKFDKEEVNNEDGNK